jgi:F-type H+-transporting ATPase subunit epsilon
VPHVKLIVATPLAVVLSTQAAAHVRARDSSGAFGILPGHADFLTALDTSVLTWRDTEHREQHIALRGGLLCVQGGDSIRVASPEAVAGDDLERLQSEVLVRFQREIDEERAAHTSAQRLHLAAIRQIIRLLRPESGHAAPPR